MSAIRGSWDFDLAGDLAEAIPSMAADILCALPDFQI